MFYVIYNFFLNYYKEFKTFEFKSSKEIVDYYTKEYSEYSCLTAATKLSQFVM